MDQTVAVREEPRPRGGRSAGTMTLARRALQLTQLHGEFGHKYVLRVYNVCMFVCLDVPE